MCLQDMNAFHCSVCFLNKPKYTVSETDGLCLVCLERQSRITNGLKPEEKVPDADEVVRYVAFSKKTLDVVIKVSSKVVNVVNVEAISEKYSMMCKDEEKQHGYTSDEEEKRKNVYKFKEQCVEFEEYQKIFSGHSNSDINSDDEKSNQTLADISDDENQWNLIEFDDRIGSLIGDYF
jgi:hypothetical protein